MKLHSKDWWNGYHTGKQDVEIYDMEWTQDIILGADLSSDYDCGYVFAVAEELERRKRA